MKNQKIAAIILTGIISVSLLAGCGASQGKQENKSIGDQTETVQQNSQNDTTEEKSEFCNLSSFTAKTLDGKEYTQADFGNADLTVINVWSTGCGPCIDEMPELAKFRETLPDNVNLITYCPDADYALDYTKEILDKAEFKGITLISGDGDLEKFEKQVMYTPTTIFVDSKGNQVGEAIIGADGNLSTVYKEHINKALTAMGKQVIS